MIRRLLIFFALLLALPCVAAERPTPRIVDLTATDGTKLKATYFAAGKPGPGVLLLHQCNRDRSMWNDIAPKLATLGLNVLALDFRGFGESGGPRAGDVPPQQAGQIIATKFPSDVDTAYSFLMAQPGVEKNVTAAAGASCGVNQAVLLASRHPEVKSLVLLSGFTNVAGRKFLRQAQRLPLFGVAANDDGGAVEQMEWLLSVSPNSGNRLQRYDNGGHGIEMFGPHPELTGLITQWFEQTLLKTPGQAPENKDPGFRKSTAILEVIDSPGGAVKIREQLAKARQKDPKAKLFPEFAVNLIGYEHLQAGDTQGAIDIFKLNTEAFPTSPNTYDSLADAYVAAGNKEEARTNAQRAIELLASDTVDPEPQRKLIRESAEQKLKP
jgi:dienelactone hydrolase